MKAIEARTKAHKINTDEANGQYAEVMQKIKEAVNKGDYSCYFYKSLKKDVKDKLSNLGYEISSYNDQMDGVTVTIKW